MVDSTFSSTDEKEINKIYQKALEFAKIGTCLLKVDGTIIFIDRSALQILEITDALPGYERPGREKIRGFDPLHPA